MRASLVLALLAAVMVAADDTKTEKKTAADPIKGSWRAVSYEANGQKRDEAPDYVLIFDGGKYKQKNNGEVDETGSYTLGTDKKPATIDLKILTGNDEGKTQPGIYEVSGDKLKVCLAFPGGDKRPTEFSAKEGNMCIMVEFKREKGD